MLYCCAHTVLHHAQAAGRTCCGNAAAVWLSLLSPTTLSVLAAGLALVATGKVLRRWWLRCGFPLRRGAEEMRQLLTAQLWGGAIGSLCGPGPTAGRARRLVAFCGPRPSRVLHQSPARREISKID